MKNFLRCSRQQCSTLRSTALRQSSTFFEDWGVGIIYSIPKGASTCMIAKLRPIVLQEVKKKMAHDHFMYPS